MRLVKDEVLTKVRAVFCCVALPGLQLTFTCSPAPLGAVLNVIPAFCPFAAPHKLPLTTQTSFKG